MNKCKIIAIAQQKGGVGKTTVATNLATALTTHQKGVLLVDADSQASAMDWASMNDEYYFPNMVVGMIGVAEQTAQVDNITEKLADYYEEEVDNMVKGLSSLMEPIIMVVLGGAVAFLVIAVMEPILSASDLAV